MNARLLEERGREREREKGEGAVYDLIGLGIEFELMGWGGLLSHPLHIRHSSRFSMLPVLLLHHHQFPSGSCSAGERGERTLQHLLSVNVIFSLRAPFRVFLLLGVVGNNGRLR